MRKIVIYFVISMIFLGAVSTITPYKIVEAASTTISLNPTDDTKIRMKSPDNNYGDHTLIDVRNRYGSDAHPDYWEHDVLIKFDMSSISSDKTVISATLKLYYDRYGDSNPSGRSFNLHKIIQNWDENSVTWNTRPNHDNLTLSSSIVPGSTGTWMSWDVTSDVQNIITGSSNNYGWIIMDEQAYGHLNIPTADFRSKEYGTNIPYLEITYETMDPPTADFSYINSEYLVDFTDLSSDSDGSVISYNWDFGDEITSYLQNPTHIYMSAGTYSVNLIVTDDDGIEDSVTKNVEVVGVTDYPPVAGFRYSKNGLIVSFTDTSTDSDGSIVTYNYDFGDGESSSLQNPTHTYTIGGTYSVILSVTDDDGNTDAYSKNISLSNPSNTLVFYPSDDTKIRRKSPDNNYGSADKMSVRNKDGGSSNIWQHDTLIDFDISSLSDSYTILSADLYLFYYDYGDNNPKNRVLTIYEIIENWNEETVTWNTKPDYNTQSIGTSTVPTSINKWMRFDVKSDVQDYVSTTNNTFYGWQIIDEVDWNSVNIPQVYFRTKEYGSLKPHLKIIYQETSEPDENTAPTSDFSWKRNLLKVRFTDESSDVDGTTQTYSWDFGDGTSSAEENPIHTYSSSGTYKVCLTVLDDDADQGSYTQFVKVTSDQTEENTNFYPIDDTDIKQNHPDSNTGSNENMRVRNEEGGYSPSEGDGWAWNGMIKFDLSSLENSSDISSAKLNLFYDRYKDNNPKSRTLTLHRITGNWDEDIVTWNTKPKYSSMITDQITVPASTDQWMSFDIKDDILSIINGEFTNYGWIIIDEDSYGHSNIPIVYINTKETSNIPYISIGTDNPDTDDNETSWLEITKPIEGSTVGSPVICESQGSDDIDFVEYGFHHDGYWEGSVFYRAYEPPYHYEWDETLEPGEPIKIRASAYIYTNNRSGTLRIATADIVEVTASDDNNTEDTNDTDDTGDETDDTDDDNDDSEKVTIKTKSRMTFIEKIRFIIKVIILLYPSLSGVLDGLI